MSDATVFISYSRRDREIVQRWHDGLEQLGLQVWWDKEELPGDNWLEQIENWIDDAEATLVVVSEASICSPWVCNEIRSAHRKNRRIIPVVLEEPRKGGLWLLIDHLQYVDARVHQDTVAAISEALRAGKTVEQAAPPLSKLGPPRTQGTMRKRLTLTVRADPTDVDEAQAQQFHTLLCDVTQIDPQLLSIIHLVPEGNHVLLTIELPATVAEWLVDCEKRDEPLVHMLNITQITQHKAVKRLNDRYEIIVEKLGNESGMGRVAKAIDSRIGKPVAIKNALEGDPRLLKALEREAKALASLEPHSSLPQITDRFIDNDTLYIVMTYVDGDDLQQLLDRNPGKRFTLRETFSWARQLLEVLDFLHSREEPIIHRDVKPANVKLRPDDRIVLVDFGLARFEHTELMGSTWHYAPPEQRAYKSTDQRGDLFSAAATLHHLLTGNWPGDDVRAGKKTTHDMNPLVPIQLSQLLMRAMAAEVDRRPPSARAMLDELDRIIESVFPKAETHYQRAIERQLEDDIEGAEKLLRQALDTDATHMPARRRLCELLIQQGRDEAALEQLRKLHNLDPEAGREPLLAALRRKAERMIHQRQDDAALTLCGEISSLAPDDAFAHQCVSSIWASKGDTFRDAGDLDAATTAYEQAGALEKLADLDRLRRQLERQSIVAIALDFEAEERWTQARRLYEQLARLDPDNAEWPMAGDYAEGRRAMQAQQWPQAMDAFKRVMAVNVEYKDVAKRYGEALESSRAKPQTLP